MRLLRFVPLFLLLLPALASCSNQAQESSRQETEVIPVKILPLNESLSTATISASGKFTTDDEVFLSFKTGGIINKVYVKEGDAIKPGQLLATINLTEINTQVSQASAGYEKARRDYDRITNLYKDSVASLEQLQNVKTALELAKQQLTAAQFNRNYSEIRASQNGFVLHKLANEGQVVAPGTPVLQTNGAGNGSWYLRIGVSDRDWAAIKVGDKAVVRSEATAGKEISGTVFRRSEGVDPYTGSFAIDIKLDKGQAANIASGMYGSAVITPLRAAAAGTGADKWAIPYEALLDGDGSTGYVFITNDSKTAEKVKVTIGAMEKDKIWISDGLQQARFLVISGSAYLTDKSKIKVVE
jgi:RND family efflux transporter MFP subunit